MDDKFTKVRCISACCLALGLCLNALPANVTEMTSLQPKVYIMFIKEYNFSSCTKVLYMFSSFWLLEVQSRDISHAEKKRTACKAEQIHKMTTIVTQNCPRLSFCEFVQVCKQFFVSQLEKNCLTQLPTVKNQRTCRAPKYKLTGQKYQLLQKYWI